MNESAPLTLSYFDFDGGRGEPARIALSIAGVAFTDDRVPMAEWPTRKASTPLGQMPVLVVGGASVCQSNAINRYAARLSGLYPTDAFQALLCDEAMDVVEGFYGAIGPTFSLEKEAKLAARKAMMDTVVPQYLRTLAGMLERGGGEWFADGRFTIADFKVMGLSKHLRSGVLDGFDPEQVHLIAPTLTAHLERTRALPGVVDYYEKRAAAKAG